MKSLLEQFKDLIANTSKAEMNAIWDDIMHNSTRVGPTVEEFLEYTKPIEDSSSVAEKYKFFSDKIPLAEKYNNEELTNTSPILKSDFFYFNIIW